MMTMLEMFLKIVFDFSRIQLLHRLLFVFLHDEEDESISLTLRNRRLNILLAQYQSKFLSQEEKFLWKNRCASCRYTRGRFESTHGGFWDGHTEEMEGKEGERREVTVSSANHETVHVELSRASERFTERNPWFLPIQGLRTSREQHVPESSDHSLYLMKLLRDTAEGISTHNTHIRTNHILTNPPTHRPTHHHSPSLPTLPLPHAHAHANAHVHAPVYVHARVFVYVCVYAYVDVYVHVYVYVFVFVCVCENVYDLPQWFHVCVLHLLFTFI